jgi:DNA-binding transcriptional regulator YdaS (Cro superfamily)
MILSYRVRERIRASLRRRNISQRELAAQLGVSQGMVWQWLTGRRPLAAHRARSLASALGGDVKAEQMVRRALLPRTRAAS